MEEFVDHPGTRTYDGPSDETDGATLTVTAAVANAWAGDSLPGDRS